MKDINVITEIKKQLEAVIEEWLQEIPGLDTTNKCAHAHRIGQATSLLAGMAALLDNLEREYHYFYESMGYWDNEGAEVEE